MKNKKNKTRSQRQPKEALEAERLMTELMRLLEARHSNYEQREKKLRRLLRLKPFFVGGEWEDTLIYDVEKWRQGMSRYGMPVLPWGKSLTHAHALERLDRAGKLRMGLTHAEVQQAAIYCNRVFEEGRASGRAWAKENERQLSKEEAHAILFSSFFEGELLAVLLRSFEADEEFNRRGLDAQCWLDGYRHGVTDVWSPPTAKSNDE